MQHPYSSKLSRRGMMSGLAALSGLALLGPPQAALARTLPFQGIRAMAFDGPVLILASDRFWRSSDGGASWVAASDQNAASITALTTHPGKPGFVYAASKTGGVMRSGDGGISWRSVGTGLPMAPANALTIAAQHPDTIYVALQGDGLWASKDAGDSWDFVMDRPYLAHAEHDILTLAGVNIATGMGGEWIYAGTDLGLTRVPDCFCRWQGVDEADPMAGLVKGQAAVAAKPLPGGQALLSLALAPSVSATLFAGLQSGVWKSTDAGLNWAQVSDHAAPHLAVNPTDPNHVIAAADGAILSSRDGGTTWSAPAAA